MKQVLYVDMDNVLADFPSAFEHCTYAQNRSGRSHSSNHSTFC